MLRRSTKEPAFDTECQRLTDALTTALRPLICIVIPRPTEATLLVTVSERESERYLARVLRQADLDSDEALARCIADLRAVFIQPDAGEPLHEAWVT